jgi:hypothetical protein
MRHKAQEDKIMTASSAIVDAGALIDPAAGDVETMLAEMEVEALEDAPIEELIEDEAQETIEEPSADDAAAALSALDGLEIDALDVGFDAEDVSEDDVTAAVTTVAIEEAKASAYEETSTYEVTEPAAAKVAPTKPKRSSAPKEPRAPRSAESLPDAMFVLTEDDDAANAAALKTAVLAARPTQKKVEEKFHNLLTSIAAGKKPSVYTWEAYQLLRDKGEMRTAELVAAFNKRYSLGTSRSQAGQIMNLFANLKIGVRSGNVLAFNAKSTLAAKLDALRGASTEEGLAAAA